MEEKNKFTMIFTLLFFTINALTAAPLNGEYTIGAGGTFKSVNAAIQSLQSNGVSGPVWLTIESGKYNEKINIGAIKGISALNTVTFESKTGSNSDVIIKAPNEGAAYILGLNGASFLTFENITFENSASVYGNVVLIGGNASYINFKSCALNGVEGARTGANNAVVYTTPAGSKSNISFDDTEFNNGSFGIYKKSETASSKTLISGCLFFNQYEAGMSLDNEDAPIISNNVVSTTNNFENYKGIALTACNNNTIISNNIVNAVNGRYGIFLNDCIGLENAYANIDGNSISVGGKNAIYGIAINGESDNQLINFNRIKLTIDKKQASNQAYYLNKSNGKNLNLTNNLFYDLNTGGYTIIGNTYKDFFNQLPEQSGTLSVSANGITIEKVSPVN